MSASKQDRKTFTTTINQDILIKAQTLRLILKTKGIEKDGVNELIEEGLSMVIKKYSQEKGVSI